MNSSAVEPRVYVSNPEQLIRLLRLKLADQETVFGNRFGLRELAAKYIALYLERCVALGTIEKDWTSDPPTLWSVLPRYIADAWEFLRTSEDVIAQEFRKLYPAGALWFGGVPDFNNPRHFPGALHAAREISILFERTCDDPGLRAAIYVYLQTGVNAVIQEFDCFNRNVLQDGLLEMIRCGPGVLRGNLGSTSVYVVNAQGRIQLEFERNTYKGQAAAKIRFLGEENNKSGKSFLPADLDVNSYSEAVELMSVATYFWPTSKTSTSYLEDRRAIFKLQE